LGQPGCWIFADPVSAFGDNRHTRRGSFGLVVRDLIPEDRDEDDCLILTAAHLFEGLEDGASVLFAPPGPEPKSTGGQLCGTIRRRVPLRHLPSIDVDAAVIKPPAGFECGNHLQCGMPNGIRDLWVVDDDSEPIPVRKHGAQTRLTSGELLPVAAAHRMRDVRTRYGSGWWVYGTHGASFASRGDSGSIVVDSARQVVGMVVAVESEEKGAAAFVHGIKQIFAALQIALPT
jgi:hypothetical protein